MRSSVWWGLVCVVLVGTMVGVGAASASDDATDVGTLSTPAIASTTPDVARDLTPPAASLPASDPWTPATPPPPMPQGASYGSDLDAPQFVCQRDADCGSASDVGCCSGACVKLHKDWRGKMLCPDDCKVSATAREGSCHLSCHEYFDCGGEGQLACTVDQCVPSCQGKLREWGLSGKCTSQGCHEFNGCGGENQPACTVDQCLPSCADGRNEIDGKCRTCSTWAKPCRSNGECCSNKCYATAACPFGESHEGDRVCCKFIDGNVDHNNCVSKTCGI